MKKEALSINQLLEFTMALSQERLILVHTQDQDPKNHLCQTTLKSQDPIARTNKVAQSTNE